MSEYDLTRVARNKGVGKAMTTEGIVNKSGDVRYTTSASEEDDDAGWTASISVISEEETDGTPRKVEVRVHSIKHLISVLG
jgi:hypothetical protein